MINPIVIKEILQRLDTEISKMPFGQSPVELYEPIRYTMALGGKRMRPLLTLLSYRIFRDDWERVLAPAIAVEVFHNFTLLHDDIMDKAPLRRGEPTVFQKWNESVAILSGDVMMVKAYDLLLEADPGLLPEVLRWFNKTAVEVCEGQQFDMNFEEQREVHEADYIHMIRQKTAVLLGYSLRLGAMLAGEKHPVCDALYQIGVDMGLGFQLMDDLLDVYADQSKFGKQVGGDIIANKKTYLLIKAKELAKGELHGELEYWLHAKDFDSIEKVNAVTEIYNKLGIRELAIEKMDTYYDRAYLGLEQLPGRLQYKEELTDLMKRLASRDK
ncbi:polyprenyl synthetase family protein [Peijinzhouia sedimentorum]